ncbi:TfuA-like protein [Streptomyces flavofungini]|uniref:TfuA-like protein n=1 Tax=Streptomyces flavofungini TaxID=68200 RepID=UPI0025B05EA5|nr:TfuA-like protein [Streptomyces flavofungini]WJV51658.1 TfuA-like protein [Streptomyces flavofungini]
MLLHVYVGPSLGRDAPVLADPRIRVRPPLRHGDLFDPAIADTDTVVVLDGAWHQTPAVRHKELLALLARGVRVIGGASLGAIRAAELQQFGMVGVGAVFRAYLSGDIDGDDEVAVGQAPDGDLRALTWPVVNLRHVLRRAAHEGVVTARAAEDLLTALCAVYYPQRTMAAVRAVCRAHQAGRFADWLDDRRAADPYFGDIKRADALEALEAGLDEHLPRLQPRPVAESGYYRRWANHAVASVVDGQRLQAAVRVAYQAFFDPFFPQVWNDLLEHLSRHPADGGAGVPLPQRVKAATGGGGVPAHVLFRPVPDLRDEGARARLLRDETAADRAAIVRYQAIREAARHDVPGFSDEAVDDSVARRSLFRLWDTTPDLLEDAAAARGFRSGEDAIGSLKWFIPGLVHDQEQRQERADVR